MLDDLPCGGCDHKSWARFTDEVDDVVPLEIHAVEEFSDPEESDEEVEQADSGESTCPCSNWLKDSSAAC